MKKESIPFEDFLPLNGKKYKVAGVEYKIHANFRTQKYPYVRDYIDLTAEHKDSEGKTWFTDLKQSEGITVEKLFEKMDKDLKKLVDIEE